MKILHMHASLRSGGIEAMITNLSNEMVKTESVKIGLLLEIGENDVFLNKLDKRVSVVSMQSNGVVSKLVLIWRVFQFLRHEDADVVHIHGFFAYYALAVLLLHRSKNFFYTMHNDSYNEGTVWDLRFAFLKRFCFKKGWIHPVTISHASKQSFTELYRVDSKLIYNGVPTPQIQPAGLEKFRLTPQTRLFVHAGRISPQKNQIVMCEVFKQLIEEGKDVVLLIAGKEENDNIFKEIQSYICNRIVYLGERNDVPSMMNESDAFCLFSIFEGMPVTLLEALSVGCVPICTPVGGVPEALENGKVGFLAETPTVEACCKSVNDFLALDYNQLMTMKENVRKKFTEFDIRNTAKEYVDYYKEIINKRS